MSPFGWIDWLLARLRPKAVVVEEEIATVTERRVVMLHTEALALQAKLQSDAQALMVKAGQIGATVSQVLAEGRSALSDAEAQAVAVFDPKGDAIGKLKAFIETL